MPPRLDRKTTVVGVIKNLAGQTAASPDPMHRIGRARSTTTTNNDFPPPMRGGGGKRRGEEGSRWFAIKLEYCRDTVQLELVEYPGYDLAENWDEFLLFFSLCLSFLFFFLFFCPFSLFSRYGITLKMCVYIERCISKVNRARIYLWFSRV